MGTPIKKTYMKSIGDLDKVAEKNKDLLIVRSQLAARCQKAQELLSWLRFSMQWMYACGIAFRSCVGLALSTTDKREPEIPTL